MFQYLLLLSLLLAACFTDDGLIDSHRADNRPTMAQLRGQVTEGDTGIPADRLLNLTHPQIAVVWQFIGHTEFVNSSLQATVSAQAPFEFRLDLRDTPPKEALVAEDLAIGALWLYSDRNQSGGLDRMVHPELQVYHHVIDSLYDVFLSVRNHLIRVSEVATPRVDVRETFDVGAFGTIIDRNGGRSDTLFAGTTEAEGAYWRTILDTRYRVLAYENRWEYFFTLRKRANDYYSIVKPSPGCAFSVEMPFKRKLFPKPGREKEFNLLLRGAIAAYIQYGSARISLQEAATAKGFMDYPYNGFSEPGQDWVAGRSRIHFLLYFKDEASKQELRDAEAASSFEVYDMDRLRTGYNMVACDEQYRCQFLPIDTPVRIDLGKTDEYFNPVDSPLRPPVQALVSSPVADSTLARLAGVYDFYSFYPVTVITRNGSIWMQIPDKGLVRLDPADSKRFFATALNLQAEFVLDAAGNVYKALLYMDDKRYVAVRKPGPSSSALSALSARVDSLLAVRRAGVDSAALRAITAAPLAFGNDTVKVSPGADGGLTARVPGMFPQPMVAVDSLAFASRLSDTRLEFALDAEGRCRGAFVSRFGARVFAPAIGYVPRGTRELFPGLPDTLTHVVAEASGSTPDLSVTLDGKGRYAGTGDSLFVKQGDGWIDSLGRLRPFDAVSLGEAGDFLRFRVPGLSGKAVSIELTFVPEKGSAKSQLLLETKGGSAAPAQEDDLGGEARVPLAGKPVTVTLGPWRIGADPYYIRVKRVGTADKTVACALGAYRVISE